LFWSDANSKPQPFQMRIKEKAWVNLTENAGGGAKRLLRTREISEQKSPKKTVREN